MTPCSVRRASWFGVTPSAVAPSDRNTPSDEALSLESVVTTGSFGILYFSRVLTAKRWPAAREGCGKRWSTPDGTSFKPYHGAGEPVGCPLRLPLGVLAGQLSRNPASVLRQE